MVKNDELGIKSNDEIQTKKDEFSKIQLISNQISQLTKIEYLKSQLMLFLII
jgi:hypothetical protein